jgi:Holliday junction DNA helicase RuvB
VPSRSQTRAEANFDRIHRERRQAECLAQASAEEAVRVRIGHAMAAQPPEPEPTFQPSTANDRSQNVLRPRTLAEVIGQEEACSTMRMVIDSAKARGERLHHYLLTGPAGTGKTTLANVIAEERGVGCYQVGAPVSFETLMELKDVMKDGDILFVDEIHMQAVAERRGKEAMSAPEVFLQLLEDGVIATPQGMVPFPQITVLGATTDPGRLPDAFLDRFLDLTLDEYTVSELAQIAEFASRRLGLTLMPGVAERFATASRGTPRIVGNYVKSAESIAGADLYVPPLLADQVLYKMHRVTDEGLTSQMQATLVFLYRHCKRTRGDGEVVYQASVNSIATAIGLSRDTKAVQLRVEPFLIRSGYLQVGSGGRVLTEAGLKRAQELAGG